MNTASLTSLEQLAARRRFGMRPGLDTMRRLMAVLGDPQDTLPCLHIAGTNGKGSVAAMLDAVLRAAGYRVARYTSPHLVALNERFFVDGAPVSDHALAAAAERVMAAVHRLADEGADCEPTFFEALTAVAFVLFADLRPDVVVLETGLGGRLDATNLIRAPWASVVTRIGRDHCAWLGETLEAIAHEKAGIVKPGCPVVCGAMPEEARAVIRAAAAAAGGDFTDAVPVDLPDGFALAGPFQRENAATVRAVLDVLARTRKLTVSPTAWREGLRRVVWPGRCQRIVRDGVTFWVDGAHNPDGARALVEALRAESGSGPMGLVAGFCGDKESAAHLDVMRSCVTRGWAVPIANDRSQTPAETAARMRTAGIPSEPCADVGTALAQAAAWARAAGGTVVVCGSLFLVGEALTRLAAYPWTQLTPSPNEQTLRPA